MGHRSPEEARAGRESHRQTHRGGGQAWTSLSRAATSRYPTTTDCTSPRSFTRSNGTTTSSCALTWSCSTSATHFYCALDTALTKLNTRLRRVADRRRVHRGRRAPVSVAAATAALAFRPDELIGDAVSFRPSPNGSVPSTESPTSQDWDTVEDDEQPWHIVREKEHPAEPMTVDDALFHMELLGHDFYLFLDKDSGRPSVVYRRRAYDYGVICLAAV